jgi:hypothetical protein
MSLKQPPVWSEIEETIVFLASKNVQINDSLVISQFSSLKKFVHENAEESYQCLLCHEKWQVFFKLNQNVEVISEFLLMSQFFFCHTCSKR